MQTSTRLRLTGAELIVKMLEKQGIDTVTGLPGGTILPVYDALSKSETIRHILARHEQGAGFIAHGIARSTGKPAVCLACSGPGATNLLTAIADAKLDSVPIICITGQVPTNLIGSDAFQEVDTYGISIPVTKHNYLVRSIEELPSIFQNAFRIAQSGRPGPVWIDVPKDIQLAEIELDALPDILPLNASPVIDNADIEQAANMINGAMRPVLYLGGGIVASSSSQSVNQLAKIATIPAVMTLMALGSLPADDELSLGMLGMHAKRYTNYVLNEADLLIVLGARFDDRAIGHAEKFCPNAKIIHVDIDCCEINKIKKPDLAIHGDINVVLQKLLPLIQKATRKAWMQTINQIKMRYPAQTDYPILNHYGLIQATARCVSDSQSIITTDVGKHQMWVAQSYPLTRTRQLLTSGGLGTMGFGLPAAIGAALANRDKKIICFTGDGSILLNIQEMATAVEHQLDIKIILMNNRSLGMVHQLQTLFYDARTFETTYGYQTDFVTIAKGFGLKTCDLNQSIDPYAELHAIINQPGPALIHVDIDPNEQVYPIVPPGAGNTEMIGE